jgi:hypothetical protein
MNADQMKAFFELSKQLGLTGEQEDELIEFIDTAIDVALAHERGDDR